MSKHHDHNHNSGFTTGLIIGGIIGAIAGILSAPKPGAELRSELLEKTDDFKGKADGITASLRETISPGVTEISNRIAPTISSAKEKFSPLIDEISKQFSKDSQETGSESEEPK